jgi:hypothetical protein
MVWETQLEKLSEANLTAIPGLEALGPAQNLEAGKTDLLKIRTILAAADRQAVLGNLVQTQINEIHNQANVAAGIADAMRGYDAKATNAPQERTNLNQGARQTWEWFVTNVTPWARADEVDLSALIESARRVNLDLGALKDAAAEDTAKIEALLGSSREAVSEVGRAGLSASFQKQARSHRDTAWGALVLVVVCLIAIAAIAIWAFNDPFVYDQNSPLDQWIQLIMHVAPRVVLAGGAIYALTFSSRLYRVNKHLQSVNQHRTNALDTFPLVARSMVEQKTRDRLLADLLRVTAASGDTGFLGGKADTALLAAVPGSGHR